MSWTMRFLGCLALFNQAVAALASASDKTGFSFWFLVFSAAGSLIVSAFFAMGKNL